MDSLNFMDGFLKAQIPAWQLEKKHPTKSLVGPVITVSRQTGCGAEAIAQRIAKELGLTLYSWEIVEQIAKDAHVSEKVVSTLDEKDQSALNDWLASFEGDHGLSSYSYWECLRKVVFTIAAHGNAVILGRGGNFLLPPGKKLGLCLVAPLDTRVRNVIEKLGLSEKQAREHITKTEQEHELFVREHFLTDIKDATHYHITINTALVKPETIVGIVKVMLKSLN
jgi:cytidylate kinase